MKPLAVPLAALKKHQMVSRGVTQVMIVFAVCLTNAMNVGCGEKKGQRRKASGATPAVRSAPGAQPNRVPPALNTPPATPPPANVSKTVSVIPGSADPGSGSAGLPRQNQLGANEKLSAAIATISSSRPKAVAAQASGTNNVNGTAGQADLSGAGRVIPDSTARYLGNLAFAMADGTALIGDARQVGPGTVTSVPIIVPHAGVPSDAGESAGGLPNAVVADPSNADHSVASVSGGAAVLTGGTFHSRNFTDSRADEVMKLMVAKMRPPGDTDQTIREVFDNSVLLAAHLIDVSVAANIHTTERSVRVGFTFGEGANFSLDQAAVSTGPAPLKLEFAGSLSKTSRSTTLLSTGSPLASGSGSFRVTITCVDKDTISCQHSLLVLEQLNDTKNVCKRLFVIHRFGDAKLEITDQEYYLYRTTPANQPFLNASQSANQKHFYKYLANTVHFNRYVLECIEGRPGRSSYLDQRVEDGTCQLLHKDANGYRGRAPRAKQLGMRTWAAAFGPSAFEIFLGESQVGAKPIDVFFIKGLLLEVGSKSMAPLNPPLDLNHGGYAVDSAGSSVSTAPATGQPPVVLLSERIDKAELVANNGRGAFEVIFHFKDEGATGRVKFLERMNNTYSSDEMLRLKLFPE